MRNLNTWGTMARMPITKGAKKALAASHRKHAVNVRRKHAMSDAVKEVRGLVTAGKKDEALALYSKAQQAIDKAVKGGILKPHAGARKKSRLANLLK